VALADIRGWAGASDHTANHPCNTTEQAVFASPPSKPPSRHHRASHLRVTTEQATSALRPHLVSLRRV